MSDRERRMLVLDAIVSLSEARGFPPTVREIAECVGLRSASSVVAHLRGLRHDGLITWTEGSPRTIRVVAKDEAS